MDNGKACLGNSFDSDSKHSVGSCINSYTVIFSSDTRKNFDIHGWGRTSDLIFSCPWMMPAIDCSMSAWLSNLAGILRRALITKETKDMFETHLVMVLGSMPCSSPSQTNKLICKGTRNPQIRHDVAAEHGFDSGHDRVMNRCFAG